MYARAYARACAQVRMHGGFRTHLYVLFHLSAFDVEDVDEHGDVTENVVALRLKVRFHVGLLAPAVPEVEHEVAKEANVRVLDVLGVAEARRLTRNVVGKDDGAHRRLAGVALAHEQHLFPLRLHRPFLMCFFTKSKIHENENSMSSSRLNREAM